jgi:uncharacterized protein (TIGR03435 family)
MRHLTFAAAIAAILASAPLSGQQPAPPATDPNAPVSFEVATVKANKSGDQGGNLRRQPGGRITATNMPLRTLIIFAYQLQQFQLVGGPGSTATDRFDIVAKLEGDPAPVMPGSGPDQLMLAMRTLLADRFNLKAHRETRELDIYALVMARPGGQPGPALKPSTQDCSPQALAGRRGAPPPSSPAGAGPVFCGVMGSPGKIRFGGFPLSQFSTALAGQTGRFVVDRTGLTGNWDFELTFAPDQRGPAPPPGVDVPPPDPNAPSIFTAIQEQLGLKLEGTKGPVQVLVIDSVDQLKED